MVIISGGQTGVDRAALDEAIERGLSWGGWCPKGGWAEDLPHPPGLLTLYPHLKETPLGNPLQRTQWNIRDSDATLLVTGSQGLLVSIGTQRGEEWARQHGKPFLIVNAVDPKAVKPAAVWLKVQRRRFGPDIRLGIAGPRESEAPGIYTQARAFVAALLDMAP